MTLSASGANIACRTLVSDPRNLPDLLASVTYTLANKAWPARVDWPRGAELTLRRRALIFTLKSERE